VRITFVPHAWEDYLYWQQTDRRILRRINHLIDDITRGDPFSGIGKPEPLRHQLEGAWSRRIDEVHRLVYQVKDEDLVVLAARYHY
jgi:toxin YoeB